MERVKIQGHEYYFEKGYRDDEKLRDSFNELTQSIHGFNFKTWYNNGYWTDKYVPYSIIYKDKVVANASANIIYFDVLGEYKLFIQIGTVMTDEKFRKRGLSRFLIQKIISEWKDKSDMIYLFANDSVLDFYPKFGFKKEDEYIYYKLIDHKLGKNEKQNSYKKLDMSNQEIKDFVYKKILSASVNSQLTMVRNAELAMFYCADFMKDNVYYVEEMDSIVVAEVEDDSLIIHSVWSSLKIDLDEIIKKFMSEKISKVILEFTPQDTSSFECRLYHEEGTTLFVLDDNKLFEENRFKFETLSHA